ncbi:MAG TPA: hypothetical protein VES20_14875 [Bryobacteraceae bacterium]|nr:hypothetical protein [Bryobacteraceae bacterium]
MFDSLDDTMKKDDAATSTKTERYIRYAAVAVTSIVLFGSLYLGVQLLD